MGRSGERHLQDHSRHHSDRESGSYKRAGRSSLGRNLSSCSAAGECSATVTVPLVPSGETASATVSGALFDQRLNQTDLRLTKPLRYSRGRIQAMLDLYNVFNNRAPQTINSAYGPAWLTPTTLLGGRLLKFGAQIDF